MPDSQECIRDLNRQLDWQLSEKLETVDLEAILADRFNGMIRSDFSGLVQLLYRLDVSEKKLRGLLQAGTGEDAGLIIARLVIQRQLEKVRTRQRFRQAPGNDTCEEEKW